MCVRAELRFELRSCLKASRWSGKEQTEQATLTPPPTRNCSYSSQLSLGWLLSPCLNFRVNSEVWSSCIVRQLGPDIFADSRFETDRVSRRSVKRERATTWNTVQYSQIRTGHTSSSDSKLTVQESCCKRSCLNLRNEMEKEEAWLAGWLARESVSLDVGWLVPHSSVEWVRCALLLRVPAPFARSLICACTHSRSLPAYCTVFERNSQRGAVHATEAHSLTRLCDLAIQSTPATSSSSPLTFFHYLDAFYAPHPPLYAQRLRQAQVVVNTLP